MNTQDRLAQARALLAAAAKGEPLPEPDARIPDTPPPSASAGKPEVFPEPFRVPDANWRAAVLCGLLSRQGYVVEEGVLFSVDELVAKLCSWFEVDASVQAHECVLAYLQQLAARGVVALHRDYCCLVRSYHLLELAAFWEDRFLEEPIVKP